jgi:hypothetical protein
VEAKLSRPIPVPGTVARPRLTDLLLADPPPPVVSIVAPAGYGKAMLLAEWAARARLGVSKHRVKSQVVSIYGKLGASSRGEAVDRAVEIGLLEPFSGCRSPRHPGGPERRRDPCSPHRVPVARSQSPRSAMRTAPAVGFDGARADTSDPTCPRPSASLGWSE